jgi:hypothetical protein
MKSAKKRSAGGGAPVRSDGRRAALIYLRPGVTLQLKRAAMDVGRPAYEIAEEAIQLWLKKTKRK